MTRIDDPSLSLLDFLPESIASDPDIVALSLALDPEIRSVAAAIIEAIILPRINELADDILDELAWAMRFNELQIWDVATTAQKRALLVNVFAIRKKSGTRYAVRRAFDLVSIIGDVVEWWEEAATPNTYRLRMFVSDSGITLSQLVQITELARRFARKSQQLREFATEADSTAPVYPYVATTVGRHVEISFGGP